MQIPIKEQKILWSKAAGICSISKISLTMIADTGNSVIGENAHIEGENPGSARYNELMTDTQRCAYQNLILLCPTCHTVIDKEANMANYPVSRLHEMKDDHENWVQSQTIQSINSVTFSELDSVLKYLIQQPDFSPDNLTLLNPKDKITKNNLSSKTEALIKTGLMKVSLVKKYLNDHPDIEFAERLKNGYTNKYEELRSLNYSGDDIFNILLDFSSNNSSDFLQRSAGLSVLVYFFEQCDIFEK